ncbi:DUF421 domain-containing protein [Halalkalibacter urbisdiaboli]|uniref:DUF421 domain-containing protein n=1 Tax=Halalkalibacter urbisdiaboli TaxID=1960589 RepID=UPI000B44C46E|nr:DUF421 domain-containing protein [Halalkalibacter urbisdiaboli]
MPGWLEIALRSLIGIVLLGFFARGLVRKPIGETSYLEYGLMTGLAVIVAVGSIQLSIPIGLLLVAFAVWITAFYLIGWVSIKNNAFRSIVFGKGIPLLKDGKILEDNLKKQKVSGDELLRKLRTKGAFQIADVEFAVLEGNGELNVLLKKDKQPITAKLLGKTVAPIKEPETVMMDGEILDEPLATRGLSRNWLETELAKNDIAVENVYLAQVDDDGQLTVDLFDDMIQVPQPTQLPQLKANLKKVQADLEQFVLDTENEQAKQSYKWCAEQMQEVLESVQPYLDT